MKLEDYILDLEGEINLLKKRLEDLNSRWIKWGKESEIKLLKYIIEKKEKALSEIISYKKEIVAYKN